MEGFDPLNYVPDGANLIDEVANKGWTSVSWSESRSLRDLAFLVFSETSGQGTYKLGSTIRLTATTKKKARSAENHQLADIPHIPSKFVEIVPLSHRQGNCIPYAAIRWHDFGNRPALGRPLGHFSRHPDTPLLSLSPRRRFPRPTPERVFVADHQSSSGFSGTGPSAPPPQPIGT